MGAGASIPDFIDMNAAKELTGDHFDECLFDAIKDGDGVVAKEVGTKAWDEFQATAKMSPDQALVVEEEDKFQPAGDKVIDPGMRIVRSNSGNEYSGEWNGNARNGKGKMTYKSGATYEGYYLDNKRHGFGNFKYSSGNFYEGNYFKGKKNGKGKFTFHTGSVYEGSFKDDQKHGKGIFRYKNGNVFEGEYVENKRTGKGIMTAPSGEVKEKFYADRNEQTPAAAEDAEEVFDGTVSTAEGTAPPTAGSKADSNGPAPAAAAEENDGTSS